MRRRLLAVAVLALAAAAILSGPAYAQQVTGLTAEQEDGFTTLAWNTIPGATDYQIERTPVDAANVPTGAAVIAGLWRPNRTITPEFPTFAESGYNPGDRFQWRVRARLGPTNPQPFSLPVFGTTLAPWGNPAVPGENLRTQWEQTQAASFTNDVNEYAYTAALDEASDRVRVVEIGRTLLDRPINMFVIGYPSPPATAAAISSSPTALVNCNVHGNEPSSREACLILARELAFGNDARTIDILSHATVLLVPSINGDGRAANQRGNSTGQDLNRDYSLIRQPETFSFVRMMRDYTPQAAFDGHEFGNNNAGDLPVLPPRHLNVAQSIFDQSMDLIEGSMYVNGSADGWWYCPYGCQGGGAVGLSEETILRNTMGLKSTIGSLLEARSAGGATRPNEGAAANNRRRKTYSALYTYQRFFEYHRANEPEIADSIDESLAFQRSNTGRIVFRGSRPIPPHPAPHPGESPPPEQNPGPELILENPPCGYLLTDAQYNGVRDDSPPGFPTTVAQRVGAHGWAVDTRPAGYIVRLAQAQRGLIPLLLDGAGRRGVGGRPAALRVPARGGVAGEPVGRSGGRDADDPDAHGVEPGRRAEPESQLDDHRGAGRLLLTEQPRLGLDQPRQRDDRAVGDVERHRDVLHGGAHGARKAERGPVPAVERPGRAADRRPGLAPGPVSVHGLLQPDRQPAGVELGERGGVATGQVQPRRLPRPRDLRRGLPVLTRDRLRDEGADRPGSLDLDRAQLR